MISNKEKELLFEEFKNRMEKERQGYASGYETLHNLEPAKDYFWDAYHQMTKSYMFDVWSPKGMNGSDWDLIRKLVCHANGVSIVKGIPSDRLNESNELAKQIVDLLFNYNKKILEEEY